MTDNVIEFSLRATDEFEGVFRSLSNALGVAGKAAAAFAGTAVAVSAAAFAVTKKVADFEDELQDLSEKLELNVETLSRWAHAAEMSDVSLGSLTTGIQFLNRNIAEAAEGNAKTLKTFRDLGISVTDATGALRTGEQVMPELADRIAAMGSGAQRTRVEMELLGRSGAELNKLLRDGSEAFAQAARDAEFLGVAVGKQAAANASEFDKQWKRVQASVLGAGRAFGDELIPVLTGAFQVIANWIAANRETFRQFGKVAVDVFVGTIVAAQMLGEKLKELWGRLKQAGLDFLEALGLEPRDVAEALDATLKVVIEFTKIVVTAFWEAGKLIAGVFFELGRSIVLNLKSIFKGGDPVGIEELLGNITNRVGEFFTNMSDAGSRMWSAVTDDGKTAFDALKDTIGGDDFLDAFKLRMEEMRAELTRTGQAEVEETTRTVQLTLEQRYRAHEEQLRMLNEEYEARIFYAESMTEVVGLTLDRWAANIESVNQAISTTLTQTLNMVVQGFGQAVANAIVYGKNFGDALKSLFQQTVAYIITQLVQMGVQRLIFAAINKSAAAAEAASNISSGLGQVFVNSFASAAAIPVVGWAIAPHVATANLALASAGAAGAIAAGAGIGATVGVAHGGLSEVPSEGTFLLDRGERVLSPGQNEDLTSFLDREEGGAGGRGVTIGELTLNINVPDSQALRGMSRADWRDIVAENIIPALDALDERGVRPLASQRGRR